MLCMFSPSWRGGSGWFVQETAMSIAEAGGRVLLISPEAEPVAREPVHANVQRWKIAQGTGGRGSLILRIARTFRRTLTSFGLLAAARLRCSIYLVTMTSWPLLVVLQFVWIRVSGARLIHVVHDVTPHAWGFPERFRALERALVHLTYTLPTRLVTLTEAAKAELVEKHRISDDKITVIPHGAYETRDVGPLPGSGLVLAFGMLRRNKRILETIQAMALLPASSCLRLVIAGEPHAEDPEYWKICAEAAAENPDRVRTEVGFVPEARVNELLKGADALILPYESFNSQSGVAILAAFAERVVIATDSGGIGELQALGLEPIQIERPVTPRTIADALAAFETMSQEEATLRAARSKASLEAALSRHGIGERYVRLLV